MPNNQYDTALLLLLLSLLVKSYTRKTWWQKIANTCQWKRCQPQKVVQDQASQAEWADRRTVQLYVV